MTDKPNAGARTGPLDRFVRRLDGFITSRLVRVLKQRLTWYLPEDAALYYSLNLWQIIRDPNAPTAMAREAAPGYGDPDAP